MANLKTLIAVTVLACGSALAADVTGNWSGTVIAKTPSGETNTEQAWMSLKQSGKVVTGTAGAHAGQQSEIRDGKTDGEQVEFKVTVGEAAVTVRLKLAGDALKGQAIIETPDGQMTASLDLKRVP